LRPAAALAVALLAALQPGQGPTHAAATVDSVRAPGGAPQDIALAASDPDEYAWRLFFYLNRQARPGAAGLADPSHSIRQYDPDTPVVWETWALVSGASRSQVGSEVFRPDGADPGPWAALPRSPAPAKILAANLTDPDALPSKEIRINQAAYDFIVGRGLYNRQGLQRLYAQAVALRRPDLIQFPTGAQEIKADWLDLGATADPAELARYHWRRIGGHYWGLAALHLATKDLADWVWADFEQVDQPFAPGEPSRDSTTRTDDGSPAPAKGAVEGERRELTDTKWAYYRLRGVQISFTDPRGQPTRLSDSMIEAGFQHTSCMTCHARATIRFQDGKLSFLEPGPINPDAAPRPPDLANPDLGAPSPALFGADGLDFIQTDFVWSIPERAQPAKR
jgi:hypothetical protein